MQFFRKKKTLSKVDQLANYQTELKELENIWKVSKPIRDLRSLYKDIWNEMRADLQRADTDLIKIIKTTKNNKWAKSVISDLRYFEESLEIFLNDYKNLKKKIQDLNDKISQLSDEVRSQQK